MKQFREDGARLCVIKNPNPKGPDVLSFCKNYKSCLFCEHCQKGLDLSNPKSIKALATCQLPSVSPKGNCSVYMMNIKQTCGSFKDVEKDDQYQIVDNMGKPLAVAIKKKTQPKPEIATFNISKKGVEQVKK